MIQVDMKHRTLSQRPLATDQLPLSGGKAELRTFQGHRSNTFKVACLYDTTPCVDINIQASEITNGGRSASAAVCVPILSRSDKHAPLLLLRRHLGPVGPDRVVLYCT